ncbi:XrtA/PEP-CTERM system exopolysaccharide export protein [Nitrosococcus halophilus]|nr:XrtA/PEP-CTERM system exopolysaccharide export protein [Nitrosococcus halophilus]
MPLRSHKFVWFLLISLIEAAMVGGVLSGCVSKPPAPPVATQEGKAPYYIIGPGDELNIFVWGNSELSTSVVVRPDGRITAPLVEDLQASGRTPTELARDIEKTLSPYVRTPIVTVMVSEFIGRFTEQVRVVGEATEPQVLSYQESMSLLDVMIAVGGLTEFAAGNEATLVRTANGQTKQFSVRLDDLLKDGDITANVEILPGDILIIPEAWF